MINGEKSLWDGLSKGLCTSTLNRIRKTELPSECVHRCTAKISIITMLYTLILN